MKAVYASNGEDVFFKAKFLDESLLKILDILLPGYSLHFVADVTLGSLHLHLICRVFETKQGMDGGQG